MNPKKLVGIKAASFVEDGMVVGLGTGSTAHFMVEELGRRMKEENLSITCVSTSTETEEFALSLGLNMKTIDEVGTIDLTIDGADEVSPKFYGIKGGGGALLFEKIVAIYSKKNIWIVDDSKLVDTLGQFPLPVEVVPFASELLFKKFTDKGYAPAFRMHEDDTVYVTDSKNYILDLSLEKIENPKALAEELKREVGVVEHGLFIDIADLVIVGNEKLEVEILTK